LDVADVIPSSLGYRNDVVIVQVVLGVALHAAAFVTLPDKVLHFSRNAITPRLSEVLVLDTYSA